MDQRGDDFTVHPQALSTVIERVVLFFDWHRQDHGPEPPRRYFME